ncbi:transcriptional regulator [Halobacillus salinarum]|uniref:Transcriptional regulator n=1 Tax=Halobacillus salinarum TaxID=2932257 RepID=A0ABY4EDT3_9BACI|nr:transcriptional regulator [Halobacillus salinarum]UOQ42609.1 transcriptional regulator [Halobacillus salinarum]
MTKLQMFVLLPVLAVLLLTQSTLLFTDAKKKGNYAWLWGIWGLIQLPMPSLFYWLFVIIPRKRRRKNEDFE